MNNIVRIGRDDKREIYYFTIIQRMSPHIYNKKEHKCIIVQVKGSLIDFADSILKKLKWAGLKEVHRERKDLANEKAGYILENGWEIILKKHPVLEAMEEDE